MIFDLSTFQPSTYKPEHFHFQLKDETENAKFVICLYCKGRLVAEMEAKEIWQYDKRYDPSNPQYAKMCKKTSKEDADDMFYRNELSYRPYNVYCVFKVVRSFMEEFCFQTIRSNGQYRFTPFIKTNDMLITFKLFKYDPSFSDFPLSYPDRLFINKKSYKLFHNPTDMELYFSNPKSEYDQSTYRIMSMFGKYNDVYNTNIVDLLERESINNLPNFDVNGCFLPVVLIKK